MAITPTMSLKPVEWSSRAEDYLNDKLQTVADLEGMGALLSSVQDAHKLLKQQLDDAAQELKKATDAYSDHTSRTLQVAEDFSAKQSQIDSRLLVVTRSEASDEAVHKFEGAMAKLRRLEITTNYIELLQEVTKLRYPPAIEHYARLCQLSKTLQAAQPAAEGAAPHLIAHVEQVAGEVREKLRKDYSTELETVLQQVKWPEKTISIRGLLEEKFREAVGKLLDLQKPDLDTWETDDSGDRDQEPLILLPLEVIVRPLDLRFKYHFESDRPTNRLDKPEYFLSHILGILNSYSDVVSENLQPILSARFLHTNLALSSVYIDSISTFITALLPMVRRKVFSLVSQVASQPQLFSHLVHELMQFDNTIRDEWNYDGGHGMSGWRGLTWELLVKKDWFGAWLQMEKNFALARYQTIVDNKESGEIDYDSLDRGTTKPTKAAIRVRDLLETVTERYRPLSSFSQKVRFLIDIQISIFDRFHERLHASLETYLAMTSSVARTVHAVNKEDLVSLEGLGWLDRLCRVYGSAEYLEKAMSDWSDDIFFLELWEELQDRARQRQTDPVTGDTSREPRPNVDSEALFEETAGAYGRLKVRTEIVLKENLVQRVRDSLKPYGRINPWSSLSPESGNARPFVSVSPELDPAIQQLTSYLSFLSRAVGTAQLLSIFRHVAKAIQTYVWDHVLLRNSFSPYGIIQLERDMRAVSEVMDQYLGQGQAERSMQKLRDALALLSLQASTGKAERPKSLEKIEEKIFTSNEDAREALEELGLEMLTESDARAILERRVDLTS